MMKVIENNDSEYNWKPVQQVLRMNGNWKQIEDLEYPENRVYLFRKTSEIEMRDIREQLGKMAEIVRVPDSVWDEYEE